MGCRVPVWQFLIVLPHPCDFQVSSNADTDSSLAKRSQPMFFNILAKAENNRFALFFASGIAVPQTQVPIDLTQLHVMHYTYSCVWVLHELTLGRCDFRQRNIDSHHLLLPYPTSHICDFLLDRDAILSTRWYRVERSTGYHQELVCRAT